MSNVKVFAGKHRTFLLTADDGSTMTVRPNLFQDIPIKFTGDITFKRAVAAGDIQVFETTKQGDDIEKKAYEKAPASKQSKKSDKADNSETPNEGDKAGDAE